MPGHRGPLDERPSMRHVVHDTTPSECFCGKARINSERIRGSDAGGSRFQIRGGAISSNDPLHYHHDFERALETGAFVRDGERFPVGRHLVPSGAEHLPIHLHRARGFADPACCRQVATLPGSLRVCPCADISLAD